MPLLSPLLLASNADGGDGRFFYLACLLRCLRRCASLSALYRLNGLRFCAVFVAYVVVVVAGVLLRYSLLDFHYILFNICIL